MMAVTESGTVFQRHLPTCPPADPETKKRPKHKCAGRWVAMVEDGFTRSGARRRRSVTAKTEAAVRLKLRNLHAARRAGQDTAQRTTVKRWADEYLSIRVRVLSPKAYRAAESPIRRWVVPTIGHKRLNQLTPGDVRAVHDACRAEDRSPGDVHRAMHTMLEHALVEGHAIAPRVLKVKAPAAEKSDRKAMTEAEGIACLAVATELPHGSRWLFTLLYGARMGECLGLTWDAVDFEAGEYGEAVIEWQLQSIPYVDRNDKSLGFRVPDGFEARHLVDAFHLVRPKSAKGWRVAPLLPVVRDGLLAWREVAPENPWGLVWPTTKGRPANDKSDRAEWWALQETAEVAHPTRLREDRPGHWVPAPYHVHECRNFAATMLLDSGVPEHVVTDLLGHSTVATSLRYRTVRREPLLDAMRRVGERLQLG